VSARERLERLLGREEVRAIARRYFVSNGFDGALTGIGVVLGAVLSGAPDARPVVAAGLGAAVGLGTSAVWSVWEIERVEQAAAVERLERAMLTDLDDTAVTEERALARAVHAVASGLGPLVGILVPLSPFFLEGQVLTLVEATVASVGLGVGVLAAFGAYVGLAAGRPWYVAAARMALAGVVVAALNLLLAG
jgi:predicted membrane protein (TIGR00267 family)